MEYRITLLLTHLCVDEITRVAELDNLLSQELDSHRRIAEDNRLGDVELTEKSIEAMDFMLLVDIAVVLGDTFEGELVHDIDGFAALEVFLDEAFDLHWISSWEKHDLARLGEEIDDLLNDGLEIDWEKFVSFIEDYDFALAEIGDLSVVG